jgi:hypothetical protein
MTILHRIAFLLLPSIFLLSSNAAPPPELTILRQQYEKAYAERVTAVHEAAVAELNAKFTAALDNAIEQAKTSGDLPTVLAFQADQKRLVEKMELPAADADNVPEALKNLRSIYREQIAKINEQHTANVTALQAPYTARLQELEATLTKNDRVEEATAVMAYSLTLPKESPSLPVPEPPAMAAVGSAPASTIPATPPQTNRVKGDDRKAAEWVLSVGGTVQLWDIKASNGVKTIADLPKGEFHIRSIQLKGSTTKLKPFSDSDFAILGGLERLDAIDITGLEITPAALDVLTTCPKLRQIGSQYNKLGDELWAHLANAHALEMLFHGYDSLPVTGIGISKLKTANLSILSLATAPIIDEALPEIANFSKLLEINLERTKITDTGIVALAELQKLRNLSVRNTDVTAVGLTSLRNLPLTTLGYGRTISEMAAQAAEVAKLFPKVTRLFIPVEANPTTTEWNALATAWPKLTDLYSINSREFTDEACEGIVAFQSLEDLQIFNAPKVTDKGIAFLTPLKKIRVIRFLGDAAISDAALVTLAEMRSLKILKLPNNSAGITPAGIATFKKSRPDIKLE